MSAFLRFDKKRTKANVPDFRDAPHYRGNLEEALAYFSETIGRSDDYVARRLTICGRPAACLFINTVTDPQTLMDVLRAIQRHPFPKTSAKNFAKYVLEQAIPVACIVVLLASFVPDVWFAYAILDNILVPLSWVILLLIPVLTLVIAIVRKLKTDPPELMKLIGS